MPVKRIEPDYGGHDWSQRQVLPLDTSGQQQSLKHQVRAPIDIFDPQAGQDANEDGHQSCECEAQRRRTQSRIEPAAPRTCICRSVVAVAGARGSTVPERCITWLEYDPHAAVR